MHVSHVVPQGRRRLPVECSQTYAGNVLQPGISRSTIHDVLQIQHAALNVRERLRDGLRRRAVPSGDVDQGAYPLKRRGRTL